MIFIYDVFIFILGLFFGSFSNVCIYRLPRNESIIFPPSHCPNCSQAIKWYDNIPLISFMLLGAKCRFCKQPISWRYPLVEFITGVIFLLFFIKFGPTRHFMAYAVVAVFLVVITSIDLKEQTIPDELTYTLLFLGLFFSLFNSKLFLKIIFYFPLVVNRFLSAYVGMLVGGGVLYFIAWISKGGMGGGDIKLAGALGTILGWENILWVLGISFLLGGAVGVGLLASGKKKRKDPIPFGPFIALAAVIVILFENQLYQTLFFYIKP